jgi:hypothetical protein
MSRLHLAAILVLVTVGVLLLTGFDQSRPYWPQWGRTPQHTGRVTIPGEPLNQKLADIVYDPFTTQEKDENYPLYGQPVLTAHFQATLVDGFSFYMLQKTGTYISCSPHGLWAEGDDCGPNAWNSLVWNVVRYNWTHEGPKAAWMYWTDWKPEPNATNYDQGYGGLSGWEPVFHPALANGYLYVPGAGGTIWKVNTATGQTVSHINPFGGININPANTYVAGPLSVNANGTIYYNAVELNTNGNPWDQNDVAGSWLVKVDADDSTATVTYKVLVPHAPPGTSTNCEGTFFNLDDGGASLPWPPSANAVPPTQLCGSQRAPINLAPAIAPDGTIYTVSMAHHDNQVAYLVAVNPDLTPKWAASLQYRLSDGCGVILQIAPQGVTNEPNSCRFGTTVGVDPTTNAMGSGAPTDLSSATPTVLPDGSVLFGAVDNYDFSRGHLFHFDAQGNFINSYTFGWDNTPGVYQHDGTWSIIVKDNHYGGTAYCNFSNPVCTPVPSGPYYVSQLDANLNVEWSFQNTTFDNDHPNGYEWCVNAPVIDSNGIVYATSEDGHVYSIPQGNTGPFTQWKQKIFLLEALGAAYTPMAIGDHGEEYTQNNGHLFAIAK